MVTQTSLVSFHGNTQEKLDRANEFVNQETPEKILSTKKDDLETIISKLSTIIRNHSTLNTNVKQEIKVKAMKTCCGLCGLPGRTWANVILSVSAGASNVFSSLYQIITISLSSLDKLPPWAIALGIIFNVGNCGTGTLSTVGWAWLNYSSENSNDQADLKSSENEKLLLAAFEQRELAMQILTMIKEKDIKGNTLQKKQYLKNCMKSYIRLPQQIQSKLPPNELFPNVIVNSFNPQDEKDEFATPLVELNEMASKIENPEEKKDPTSKPNKEEPIPKGEEATHQDLNLKKIGLEKTLESAKDTTETVNEYKKKFKNWRDNLHNLAEAAVEEIKTEIQEELMEDNLAEEDVKELVKETGKDILNKLKTDILKFPTIVYNEHHLKRDGTRKPK